MIIKNKIFFIFFIISISCAKPKSEIKIVDEPCRFIKENGNKYLICDERKKEKIVIKSILGEKELNQCKRTKSIVTKKGVENVNSSIICKTNFGFEIIN